MANFIALIEQPEAPGFVLPVGPAVVWKADAAASRLGLTRSAFLASAARDKIMAG